MIFIDHNNSFEMNLVGYQFKGRNNDEFDDNWLNIEVKVSQPNGSWSSTDPSLLTWEVARLIEWLESNGQESTEIDFIEPNIRFEFIPGNRTTLRIYFELESRPNWAPSDVAGMDDLWADFEVTPRDLKAAADSLRRNLENFPERRG